MTDVTPAAASPFDSLRRVDADGEHWSARDLMSPLGYLRWESFADAIERAKIAACNSGHDCDQHFSGSPEKLATVGRPRADYRLTRFAAYLLAMNGDPRKTEVAAAQSYFAIKTREAELARPLSMGEFLLQQAQMMVDAERRTAATRSTCWRRPPKSDTSTSRSPGR